MDKKNLQIVYVAPFLYLFLNYNNKIISNYLDGLNRNLAAFDVIFQS